MVRFILEVEDVILELLRGDRRRLVILIWLPVVCYFLMAVEVWVVFWAIGQPIGFMEGLTIETFTRLSSVASAAIPANIGALEASNTAVVTMLGLTGRVAGAGAPHPGALMGGRRARDLSETQSFGTFESFGTFIPHQILIHGQPDRAEIWAARTEAG